MQNKLNALNSVNEPIFCFDNYLMLSTVDREENVW